MGEPIPDIRETIRALEELRAQGRSVGHGFAVTLSKDRTRRRVRVKYAIMGAWLGVLLVAVGWFAGSHSTAVEEPQVSPQEQILALRAKPTISDEDEAFLRRSLFSESTLIQRLALTALGKHKVQLSMPYLEAMLDQPQYLESLDTELVVAGPGDIEDAQAASKSMTLSAVLFAMTMQARGRGVQPSPDRVERFLRHHSKNVRKYVVALLAANPEYRLSPDARKLVESDVLEVREEAEIHGLLDRK